MKRISSIKPVISHAVIPGLLVALVAACGDPTEPSPAASTEDADSSGNLTPTDDATQSGGESGAVGAEPSETDEVLVEERPEEAGTPTGVVTEETACVGVASEGQAASRPMDVILVIDNSGSMGEEIAAVERNINVNFSQILTDSNIDHRVIMVSAYRPGAHQSAESFDTRVCIEAPLGPSECASRSSGDNPHNESRFIHFDHEIRSTNSLCAMLDTFSSPPFATNRNLVLADDPLLQDGWGAHLRQDAHKAFIMIGDDEVDCEWGDGAFDGEGDDEDIAAQFDAELTRLAPEHFGTTDNRTYAWHSIVGIAAKDPLDVYEPGEPLTANTCVSAETAGTEHQALSRLSGGLRFPVCSFESYDAIFRRIAAEVLGGAQLPCSWEIPETPPGEVFDQNRVNLTFTPPGAEPVQLDRVGTFEECGSDSGWYYDDPANPTVVNACPASCTELTNALGGRVDLLFGCQTQIAPAR